MGWAAGGGGSYISLREQSYIAQEGPERAGPSLSPHAGSPMPTVQVQRRNGTGALQATPHLDAE